MHYQRKTKQRNAATTEQLVSFHHTGMIVARILSKRLEIKIEEVIEEDKFGFREGKGTRDAIVLMRIISVRGVDVKEEMCLCFIDWQKARNC